MNNYKKEINHSLLNATQLIFKVLQQEISLEEFVKQYNNFYYYEALDGHEADVNQRAILSEFSKAIQLHKKIQCEVIDLLYLENVSKEVFKKAGRINKNEAIRKLSQISNDCEINQIIVNLSS